MLAISPLKFNMPNNNTPKIAPRVQPMGYDTVSFSGKGKSTTIADYVENAHNKDLDRLNRIATTYLDALESVAWKLRDQKVDIDRAYCEKSPVKSGASVVSKISRSGTFNVPDMVRATIYIKNPYDLKVLNDNLLPEMAKRGYVLAIIPATGQPDLDIRLEDVLEVADVLDPKLKNCVGKPQKSGYEDIQMRFVRDYDPKKNKMQHELIVIFGPNYAKAKHLESEKIYEHTRKFSELNILQGDKFDDHIMRARRYVDLIKETVNGKISKKLYINAKNEDCYDILEKTPIEITDETRGLMKNYFLGLSNRIDKYYNDKIKYADDLGQSQLMKKHRKDDKSLIKEIEQGLMTSVDYFMTQKQ